MKITNNYSAVIVLPPDVGIAIGGSVEYQNWDAIKDMPNIAWHVEVGNLSVEESEIEDSTEDSSDESEAEPTEDEQKEALIAQLAELEIKADKRSSVETLQQKLDEALAK